MFMKFPMDGGICPGGWVTEVGMNWVVGAETDMLSWLPVGVAIVGG